MPLLVLCPAVLVNSTNFEKRIHPPSLYGKGGSHCDLLTMLHPVRLNAPKGY